MRKHNGKQLYGFQKILTTLKMGRNKEIKKLSIRQKLAMNYVSKESKLTRIGDKIYTNTFTPYFPSLAYDRFLKGVISITSGNPLPVVTNFAVTPRCPCNCWHCSFSDRSKKDILSLDQLKKAIYDVQDLGTSVIGLTGGEPLLRDDLEDIIASIDKRSMPVIFTTGYKLTRDRVKSLKKAGLEIPVISLDHYKAEIHDRGRRKEGIFDAALNAIKLFQDEGFYVAVSFVPDKPLVSNRREIFKVIDFFKEIGINDMRLTSPILSGKLTSKPEERLSAENVNTIFEIQKKCTRTRGYPGVFAYDFFESEKYYGCGAGFNYMFIDSQGNVCPCDFTMLSFGNMLERPIREIWEETSKHFCAPGPACYANISNDVIFSKREAQWPLKKEATLEILEECPSYHEERLPEFYKKMGFPFQKSVEWRGGS
ncbi:MAG: radical SAM protein [Deltaproteobacteria bacterium]|jgi:MoaA/NifB/PqqE/SkfB family radical SAM enzyme|nr:radical SAM protein [Deltaproteobacteria bacterium]MBW2202936.1 radical SAM protein [Deltaproteobacteria bacterium]